VLNTIGLIILFAITGFWLAKHEGLSVLARMREQVDAGRLPTDELISGGLVVVGGLLLIVPGFITDGVGLLLLFPPTRALARTFVRRYFRIRVYNYDALDGPPDDDVIDI